MPLPNTKQQLADWMLRRLGAPVVNIEISDEQLEDCIDEAVQFYHEWHFDGAQRSYRVIKLDDVIAGNNVRHQNLTAPDFVSSESYEYRDRVMYNRQIWVKNDSDTNIVAPGTTTQWVREDVAIRDMNANVLQGNGGQFGIKIPDSIIAVTKVHRVDSFANAGIYNYEYQYFLNNFDWFFGTNSADGGMTNYYITKTYVDFIDYMLNTTPAIRYNKQRDRLWLDIDWRRLSRSSNQNYLLVEVYEVADPEVYGQVYSDSWLKRYATALAKQQWGTNMKKYEGTELPGGITINGQQIYDEAREEVVTLEEELRTINQLEMDSIIIG